jgi:hypothetical protein
VDHVFQTCEGVFVKLIGIVESGRTSRLTTKEQFVAAYRSWEDSGSLTPPTSTHLLGLFYARYKERYRLYPCSNVREDLGNIERFVTQFMGENPTLAPFVIEYFFSLRHFSNIQSATFCNANILSKWGAFERAAKMQSHFGVGEQAEFTTDTRAYGSTRV